VNVYVVVEGRVVEKAVYTVWIPEVNRALRPATYLENVANDHFYIVSGNGYPAYFDIVYAALEDVNDSRGVIDRLVICVDSEEMTLEEKREELVTYVEATGYGHIDYRVVVQHFCFEAWALGNRVIGSRNPQNESLQRYRRLYNVLSRDPEGLPALPEERLTRSQFAEKYLRLTLNDRNKNLSYSKGNPRVVAHPKFFREVSRRLNETDHIRSFRAFIDAFI
jgi:hypothetical protein